MMGRNDLAPLALDVTSAILYIVVCWGKTLEKDVTKQLKPI